MNKHSHLKRSLIVMFIISLVFIVGFVATYIFLPVVASGNDFSTIRTVLEFDFNLIKQSFILPFDANKAAELTGAYNSLGPNVPLIISIVVYVVSGLTLILLVLGIVYACNKHKPLYCIYSLAVLVSLYIAYIVIVSGASYIFAAKSYFEPATSNIGLGIMNIAVFALGCLAFAFVVTTIILGLVYASKMQKVASEEEQTNEATVAELAADPEAVQEGEELTSPENAALIESEPEPLPEETTEEIPVVEEETADSKVEEETKTEDKQRVEINVNNSTPNAQGIDQASLATLLREVVRDIVRDEIARNNLNQPQQPQQNPNGNQTITGATFGGPLVVQYFNGGINGVSTPTPVVNESKPAEKIVEIHKEEAKPTPTPVEEKKEEPKPARPLFAKKEVVEQPKPAENAAPEVVAAPAPVEEAKKYERISFAERLLQSEQDIHDLYNELKNEILSYGVKSRISAVGDTFRLHKKMYVRITVAGKSLKLYFALNPADYANSTLPIQDASEKDMYQEIPLVFKVKSPLSVRRCKELIQDVMEKDGLEQGEIGKVNWIKELKAEMASGKKPEAE